jgi:hypothetical protein
LLGPPLNSNELPLRNSGDSVVVYRNGSGSACDFSEIKLRLVLFNSATFIQLISLTLASKSHLQINFA